MTSYENARQERAHGQLRYHLIRVPLLIANTDKKMANWSVINAFIANSHQNLHILTEPEVSAYLLNFCNK